MEGCQIVKLHLRSCPSERQVMCDLLATHICLRLRRLERKRRIRVRHWETIAVLRANRASLVHSWQIRAKLDVLVVIRACCATADTKAIEVFNHARIRASIDSLAIKVLTAAPELH